MHLSDLLDLWIDMAQMLAIGPAVQVVVGIGTAPWYGVVLIALVGFEAN